MLFNFFNNYNHEDLVYVPYGADKGDCPHCFYGVLRRESDVEKEYKVNEGYLCPRCGAVFLEVFKRNFKRIAVKKRLSKIK